MRNRNGIHAVRELTILVSGLICIAWFKAKATILLFRNPEYQLVRKTLASTSIPGHSAQMDIVYGL